MADRVLLVNDDGLDAPGLLALRRAFDPIAQTWVVAPREGRSATGHSITLPAIGVRKVSERVFAVDGYPADCVKAALVRLLGAPPDLVLSGINEGLNLGVNLLYSGTVAGALEGAMYGIPSFSLSIDRGGNAEAAAEWAARHLPDIAKALPPGIALNINFPPSGNGKVEIARQGTHRYVDAYHVDGERWTYDESGGVVEDPDPDSDSSVVARGMISVSPIRPDLTAGGELDAIRKLFG